MASRTPPDPQSGGDLNGYTDASQSLVHKDDNATPQVLRFTFGSTGVCAARNESPKRYRWLSRLKPYTWGLPMLYGYFCITMVFALFPPFFPAVASSKGLPAWKFGFVFSAYEITMLIGSFVIHKLLKVISPRLCYSAGLGVYVLFTLCMGSVYWICDGPTLLGICISMFAVGGFAEIIVSIVLLAEITNHFKEKSGVMISVIDLVWQSGNLIGASLGGILIDLWAYPLPFYVYGAALVLAFVFIVRYRAEDDERNESSIANSAEVNTSISGCWKLLLDPLFVPDLVTIMMTWAVAGFNETTFEPSLRPFELSHREIGNIFAVQYSCSMLGSILAGVSCHFKVESFCGFIGQICAALAYLLLGPAPFIHSERALWMVYLAQAFSGLGTSSMFTCAYCHALKVVGWRGYPDTIQTKGFVGSCVMASMMIGGLVTPPLAGYIVQQVGYRHGTMAMFGLYAGWVPVVFALWMHSLYSSGKPRVFSIKFSSLRPAQTDA